MKNRLLLILTEKLIGKCLTVKYVDMVIAANNYAGHILLLSNIGPAYTTELLYKITRMDILTQG